MSVFSRRGVVPSGGAYTNAYIKNSDVFNSPSRYTHKQRDLTPNPYKRKDIDLGTYTGQRNKNQINHPIAQLGKNCKYGGYASGTRLQTGNSYYERIYLSDYSGKGLRGWNEYMVHSKEEWQTVLKVKRLIAGKQFRGSTINIPGVSPGFTLLVDMDETLIHSEEWKYGVRYDEVVEITNPLGRVEKIGVFVRPYCLEFLERMAQKFEVVVFTAAREDYAVKVIQKLDPTGSLISGKLFRQHCSNADGSLVKDFRVIGNRKKENVILVDNLIYSYAADLENGIHIKSYVNGRDDYELEYLANVLEKLEIGQNVPQFIETNFRFKQFYQNLN